MVLDMAYFPGRVVGGAGGGRGTYSHLITIKIVWGCVRATRSLHDEVPGI